VLEPVSVGLKFGFLLVLYLFLLWIARSALRDLRSGHEVVRSPDATGLYSAGARSPGQSEDEAPRLVIERARGHEPGLVYDLEEGATLGRGDSAEIRLDDAFASSAHARVSRQGTVMVLEDLGSTNGTYLNEELLTGPAPLHPGDRIRIGECEFTYEAD
jgi:FHA domain-containing protein